MSTAALLRPRPIHAAADLLAAYLPGSFFYTSPRGTLLADGVHTLVPTGDGSHADAAAAALVDAVAAGVPHPVVVGAIGFRPDGPASLVVPAVVRRAGPGAGASISRSAAPANTEWTITERPDPSVYVDAVRRALTLISDDALRKVVLARSVELVAPKPIAVPAVLARLAAVDPAAHAFAVDVSAPGDPATRTLLGASPELLVRRRGDYVVANPLAGSAPRSADEDEDRRRAAALRISDKDRREHAVTVEQVVEVLRQFCTEVTVPDRPDVIGTATMWHLSSVIRGRLIDRSVSSLALAEALHPTPAICGVPTDRAREVITQLEPVDRGYYSGLVGWCDADGDGEWVVTIRCAEVCECSVRLFAGAGVVAGSDPEAELAETRAKFGTLLHALGASDQAPVVEVPVVEVGGTGAVGRVGTAHEQRPVSRPADPRNPWVEVGGTDGADPRNHRPTRSGPGSRRGSTAGVTDSGPGSRRGSTAGVTDSSTAGSPKEDQ